jgi:hypothetical protein
VNNLLKTQNSPSNQCDSHFKNVNYSPFFQSIKVCGEQVLLVALQKKTEKFRNGGSADRRIFRKQKRFSDEKPLRRFVAEINFSH